LWVMSHDFSLHQSIRRRTLWRMSSNIMRIARISACPNARKCAMLVPSGHRKKGSIFSSTGLRASTPSVPADYATMSEAWPWQFYTTSSSGWWLELDLSHTAVYCKYQKLYGEFHYLNRIHQDELLDFVFFLLNVQLSRTVIAMMKVSGRWEASFSSVDLGILCEYSLHPHAASCPRICVFCLQNKKQVYIGVVWY
jgi:hypothetical protein